MESNDIAAPIKSLRTFLGPVEPESFLREFYCRAPLHVPGEPSKFTHLLSWDGLNSVTTMERPHRPSLRLAKAGKVLAEQEFSSRHSSTKGEFWRVDFSLVRRLLREGATLVVDRIDEMHTPLTDICRMLEAELGSYAFADAFASWQRTQGFPTHYDPEQVFVTQLVGTKHWRVFKPERLHPTQKDRTRNKSTPPPDPYWEGDLNPGDLLYIPGGWWHDALAVSDRTLHVSLSLFPPTGLTIMSHLLRELEDEELARTPIPRFGTATEQADYISSLRSTIDAKMRGITVKKIIEGLDARAPARDRLSIPWSTISGAETIPPTAWVHWLPPRPVALRSSAAEFTFQALGTQFAFGCDFFPLIQDLIVCRKSRVDHLCSRLPQVPVEKLLLRLASLGLIVIAQDATI